MLTREKIDEVKAALKLHADNLRRAESLATRGLRQIALGINNMAEAAERKNQSAAELSVLVIEVMEAL